MYVSLDSPQCGNGIHCFYTVSHDKRPKPVLSLPLSAYLTAPITDLKHLSSHLASQSLPAGWIEHIDAHQNNCLVFASLTVSSPLLAATATFIVKIDDAFHWTVSCHGTDLRLSSVKP